MAAIIQDGNKINVTLQVGQGPPGPSTAAAIDAANRSEQARDTILAIELESMTNAAIASTAAANASASAVSAGANAALVISKVDEAISNANQAISSATSAANSAALAQIAQQGGAKVFASYAQAISAINTLSTNQVVLVVKDETRGNISSYYSATGNPVTTLTFVNETEYYFSPVTYIRSDSQNNLITKILVLIGQIPQTKPFIDADFTNPAY